MTSDELCTAELVAFALALEEEKTKKTTKRKYAVHPLNGERRKKGQFQQIYGDLRKYPEKIFSFYRMSLKTFYEMLSLVKPNL
ncbi:protein ALP1-like [Aphis craccivora]|uniref:Protein ALP1-like n=1 Tax=Aphis craccivora TaxID=307492 RepID=A0A6G0VIP9_APHCR|nr:protein ALP1-like [Aphis craccivora]